MFRRGWAAITNAQTALGIPAMWGAFAYGAGILLAAVARVPWYWRLVLFLVIWNGLLWGGVAVYAAFMQEPLARRRSACRLLREMAEAIRVSKPNNYGDASAAAAYGWTLLRAGELTYAAFDYRIVTDYTAWLKVSEDKAKLLKQKFKLDEAMAEYFENLSDRLNVHDVDPKYHHPPSFAVFREKES